MSPLGQIDDWPCNRAAAAVIRPDGSIETHGDTSAPFALASVTKLLTAAAVHLAIEEQTVSLDDRVSSAQLSVGDLLGHASGLGPTGEVLAGPGRRRVYSNAGYELVAAHVESSAGMSFASYMHDGIFAPLNMTTAALIGSPAHAGRASVEDLIAWLGGLGTLLAPETIAAMTSPYLPELVGVLPGYGRQSPNTWGLGPEIRSDKTPHWTGTTNSYSTWGHFGQAGTFLWVDPEVNTSLIILTDQPFGDWALDRWPTVSDAVRAEVVG